MKLIKPYISYEDVAAEFKEILDSGTLTRGQYSTAFPEALEAYTGAKYAFNASSATTALQIGLAVLGVGVGDEVLVSDFSFPASVNVIEDRGATPVFVDVDTDTFNMIPEQLEQKITPRSKAVIFVCALGNPTGMDKIQAICKKHGLTLIDDAACAIGSSIGGRKVGGMTDLECFSFHPRKLLTAGEGGAVTTSDPALAEQLQLKLLHGARVENGKMNFVTYGYNYRLPEMQCLMLLKQLERLDDIVKERNETQRRYAEALTPLGFAAQAHGDNVVHNMQSVVFKTPESIDRADLSRFLKAEKDIETIFGTYSLSDCQYYREKYNDVQPNAKWLEAHTLTLPCYHGVDEQLVIDGIKAYLK